MPKISLEVLLWSSVRLGEGGVDNLISLPSPTTCSLRNTISRQNIIVFIRGGQLLDVRLLFTISAIFCITIHVHKFDNAPHLGFPSAMVVKNVRTGLEFTDRHNSLIENQEVITKHE